MSFTTSKPFPACKAEAFLARVNGLPYRVGAAGPDAFDCVGLCRAFYGAVMGFALPSIVPSEYRARGNAASFEGNGWRRIAEPVPGCFVAMSRAEHISHLGIWLGGVLHATRAQGVRRHALAQVRSLHYKHFTYYTHVGIPFEN